MVVIAVAFCIAVFAYSVILHEVAHAWMADKMGDPTARLAGRISLNPLVHIDPLQTIAMPLLLWHTCGMVFGGARPVPINPLAFRYPAEGKMWTAIAGPITNLLLAFALSACYTVTSLMAAAADVQNSIADTVLPFGIRINIILACFNMIPLPPLDGSRLVAYLLPRPMAFAYERLEPFGILLLVVLLISAPAVLSPVYYAMDLASSLLINGSRVLAEAALKIAG